jgi:hypothetical protein
MTDGTHYSVKSKRHVCNRVTLVLFAQMNIMKIIETTKIITYHVFTCVSCVQDII